MNKKQKRKEFEKIIKIPQDVRLKEAHLSRECVNKNWKKDWGPILKYDFDWDWRYFMQVIVFKLEKMCAYFKTYAKLDPEQLKDGSVSEPYTFMGCGKIISQMEEAIALGYKIMNEEYDEYADKAHSEIGNHCQHYASIYKKLNPNDQNDLAHGELIETIPVNNIIDFKTTDKWCKEHNLEEYKDVVISYSGEWDSEESRQQFIQIIKDEEKQKQKDVKRFFSLLAKCMKGWWC